VIWQRHHTLIGDIDPVAAVPGRGLTASERRAVRSVADRSRVSEKLVSLVAPESYAADQYRALRHVIERRRRENGYHVIGVTSPCPGDGKTLTALNLAGALAQAAGSRVLVIDADLRRPSVAASLGLERPWSPGLSEALLDPE
jgi:Mrp family chromosome partitioning ATPase